MTSNLSGVDADQTSLNESVDATAARRYAEYEMWGRANPGEVEWLHAHPLEWVRALKALKHEASLHTQQDAAALKSHPARPPSGSGTPKQLARWVQVRSEFKELQARRTRFVVRVSERLTVASSLLPSGGVPVSDLNRLICWLADVEAEMLDDPADAKQRLGHIIERLTREVGRRGGSDGV